MSDLHTARAHLVAEGMRLNEAVILDRVVLGLIALLLGLAGIAAAVAP